MTGCILSAETYARWRATPLGEITERVETGVVFDLAGPLHGKRVLDVGTGDGHYAQEAASRGADVTALDNSQPMLDAARLAAGTRGLQVELARGTAERLPFQDGVFDLVLAVTVLCFVRDADVAVREMARVLVPGGRLVLGELGRFNVWAAKRRVRSWFGAGTWRQARFRSRQQLRELARAAGLQVVGVSGAVHFPPSALVAKVLAPMEPFLTRVRAPGAAFLALAATKPELPP
jgi:2-polyprenyl-3-methyl-5-hydroxy-6-metoxy-1,4-benzoquinol methylase